MTPEALEAAKKTLELDPLNYNIQFNLAEQALKSGDKILAKKYAQIAKESAPITTEAYIGATRILAELGE
jgi:tetratricopeptide (TPR) repeat protein